MSLVGGRLSEEKDKKTDQQGESVAKVCPFLAAGFLSRETPREGSVYGYKVVNCLGDKCTLFDQDDCSLRK